MNNSDGFVITNSATFSDASALLPKSIRAKIPKTQAQFFHGPLSVGLHQERIQGADSDVYSCRLDQDYRIIYKYPAGSKAVFFLYVGKHNEAYAWAETHCCRINPTTGGIQTAAAISPRVVKEVGSPKPLPRLSKLTDQQMQKLNIPVIYWDQLRNQVYLAAHLVGYKSLLSEASFTILEEIVGGMSVSDALELYEEWTKPLSIPQLSARYNTPPLFDRYSDEELVSVGVPSEYLDLVRIVRTESELKGLSGKLPEDAMQSLYALRSGETVTSIQKITFADSKPVVQEDYEAALANPITQSQFAVMEDEEALEAFMNAPMEKWRVFLHPSQRRLVERDYAGPARITGGAGTGKTVVIVHRAKKLARYCNQGEKILVTTFSNTLADDIRKRLESICSQDELDKIDVNTVDGIARKLALKNHITIKYNWGGKPGTAGEVDKLWAEAISNITPSACFGVDFLLDEWRDVIQAQQIANLPDYLAAQRGSRGKRLDRRAREEIWPVFEAYRSICEKRNCADIDFAENKLASICSANPIISERGLYRSILVDECQDLRAPALRMLRAIAGRQRPNDMYFSGDSRQRIYHGQASLSQCGIVVNNRSMILKQNYRTTAEIYEAAIKLQQGYQYDDLDGKNIEQDKAVCIFHGEKPAIRKYTTLDQEMDGVAEDIRKRIKDGIPANEICVINRVNKWCFGCEKGLLQRGIKTLVLTNNQADDPNIEGVRIATMHRVKGMEFSCVYIIGATPSNIPPKEVMKKVEDEDEKRDILKQEANLLSVAMTRAKKYVWISYESVPSILLRNLL